MEVKNYQTWEGCKFQVKDGFVFLNVTYPYTIFDGIYLRNSIYNRNQSDEPPLSEYSFEEHLEYINKHHLEKVNMFVDDLSFLTKVPSLKYFTIFLPHIEVDLEPLYTLSEVRDIFITKVFDMKHLDDRIQVDYSRLKGLQMIQVSGEEDINFEGITTLKAIVVREYKKSNLKDLVASKQLQRIEVTSSKIKSLDGIEYSQDIQCVELYYNRSLDDISGLLKIKDSLKSLTIDHCSKIKDYRFLRELKELEYLRLIGNNTIDNLQFIKDMINLKTLVLDLKVKDGDLTPCLNLQRVNLINNRKHYNLKNDDLPNGEGVRGIENLELWLQY